MSSCARDQVHGVVVVVRNLGPSVEAIDSDVLEYHLSGAWWWWLVPGRLDGETGVARLLGC